MTRIKKVRIQVLLKEWQVEHLRKMARQYGVSNCEAIRVYFAAGIIREDPQKYIGTPKTRDLLDFKARIKATNQK